MNLTTVFKKFFQSKILHLRRPRENVPTMERSIVSMVSKIMARPMVHGTVYFRNGNVIVTDPKHDGAYATIIVPETPLIQVFMDGEQVYGEVVVSESHSIQVQVTSVEPAISYRAVVSEDELSVEVQASVVEGVNLCLEDVEPCRHLEFVMEETHRHPEPMPQEVILNLLSKHGYTGTIDYAAVNRLCHPSNHQEEIVLRGVLPQKGLPAKFRASAALSVEHDPILHTSRFSTVSIGTTVAVLEPGTKGVPGINVYGIPIEAKYDGKQTTLNFGRGVINVNGDIVAIRDGRPRYTKQVVDVVPELIFEKDISIEDGEVQFDGNIIVNGSIQEGAVVKASGLITVYGHIEKSSVFSGAGVVVQNGIYDSKLVSGYQQFHYESLLNLIAKLVPELKRFQEEHALMVEHVTKRSDMADTLSRIPSILFEKRHTALEHMLATLVDEDSNELSGFDSAYQVLKELVESKWSGESRFKVSDSDIKTLLGKIKALDKEIRGLPQESTIIRATNVVSSSLQSVGNIIITGNVESSTLESGRTVSIRKGLRGGFVTAKKSVYVSELGTPSGIETSVRVEDQSGFIRAKVIHINTLVEVNGRRSRAYNTERNVRFGGVTYD
ncbi:FapA family protein [Alicyclobacillus sp. ALC3]|uniref:FapA family protein n=1 Tax=Alicyclobacillus sp. ALC3 TaxID=2796143 RepID=UPI002379B2D5|nr:FapA family protein [Alicyclobacillus sp. ALC3]WDL98885.1 DUF342 domain-containing protein [Alicyclobacillus sp. ALC3]